MFYLDEIEKLSEVEISLLISELWEQKIIEIEDTHKHFDPSNYLVWGPADKTQILYAKQITKKSRIPVRKGTDFLI